MFANEGARAQWRGVAAPSSGDLEAGELKKEQIGESKVNLWNLCRNHRRLFATRLPEILLFSPVCLNS